MGKFIDLTGQRFGRLLVMNLYGKTKKGESTWLCKCDCGSERVVVSSSLRRGFTKSCGCFHKTVITKHGLCLTCLRLYHAIQSHWVHCYLKNNKYYSLYGGCGWYFAKEWLLPNGAPNYNYIEEWAIDNGWDDSDKTLIFEKDKLSQELGIKEIGPKTVRFVHSVSENAIYSKQTIKVNGVPLILIARMCGIEPKINNTLNKHYRKLIKAIRGDNPVQSLLCTLKEDGVDDLVITEVKRLLS